MEDVKCFIDTTTSLVELLVDKCLRASRESICNMDTKSALIDVGGAAYDLIINYGYISDAATIISDRLSQAACMLDGIITSELGRGNMRYKVTGKGNTHE
jgi:hypothetical protein